MLREESWFVKLTELIGFRIVTLPEIAAVFEMLIDVTGLRTVNAEI